MIMPMSFTGSPIKDKFMKKNSFAVLLLVAAWTAFAQPSRERGAAFTVIKKAEHTPVKDQALTGTCWSFSTTSLVESQAILSEAGEFDLSEMFTVRNIYVEKARNYILRQGSAQFGPGGLGNDVINAMAKYGAVPESVYSGLLLGKKRHDHRALDAKLKSYLDSLLKTKPIPATWMAGFQSILDDHLGKAPETFTYREKVYTPLTFASDVLKFKKEDYVFITSFTHHPFYTPFILEIPDNYGSESYYNLPLDEMMSMVALAVQKGYSVMWDADVSNSNFKQEDGFALNWKDGKKIDRPIDPDAAEEPYDQQGRQQLFEALITQDDHLMHLVGLEKSPQGRKFFLVKNSWGEGEGPFKGYIKVSEAYFAINTISLVVPKAAIDNELKTKLRLK
jgi:bleomycin hydrolase